MKSTRFLLLVVVGLLLTTGSTRAQSPWSKLKAGALRILPGSAKPEEPAQQIPPGVGSPRPQMAQPGQMPDVHRDPQVRPATAIEPIRPTSNTARPPSRSVFSGLFKRDKRPTRTLSQYMAQEKP